MRSQLLIPVCCLGLLVACTAKERDTNVANGGSAGQGAEGGAAGSSGSGSGADGGMGGSAGDAGSAGNAGNGGSAGVGAMGGSGGAAGGAGGSAGTGGTMLTCVKGPVTELTTDTTFPPLDHEPRIAVTRCGQEAYLAREAQDAIEIFRVRFGNDGNPIDASYHFPINGGSVEGLSCDANSLRVLSRSPQGSMMELAFPLQGKDLQQPLNPTPVSVPIPTECENKVSTFLPSYNGGLHWMLECQAAPNVTKLIAGAPPFEFISGTPGEQLQLAAYAYSGGLHVGMNEQGEGWAGATAAQLGTTQKVGFEDPALRPTALATITGNSQGFFVMGITTNPPPNLLPGKLFTGQVPPSKINDIFVGGQLPSTVVERRMITSTDEIGPTSLLSQGPNTVVFSTINLSNEILFNIMKPDGAILTWADLTYKPAADMTVRRTYSLTSDPGNGNFVAWAEYDANENYRAYVRSMLCL